MHVHQVLSSSFWEFMLNFTYKGVNTICHNNCNFSSNNFSAKHFVEMLWFLSSFLESNLVLNFNFKWEQRLLNVDALTSYPERITETVVRKHNCRIFSFRAHCHNQHTWMGNKSFKAHTTSCKKANKNTYYQNFWNQLSSFIITGVHKTITSSWISLSNTLWLTFYCHTSSIPPCLRDDF